jgi:hypothetical protein
MNHMFDFADFQNVFSSNFFISMDHAKQFLPILVIFLLTYILTYSISSDVSFMYKGTRII